MNTPATDRSLAEESLHACLVGWRVSTDFDLVAKLLPKHNVTLVTDPDSLSHEGLLSSIAVVVLELNDEEGEDPSRVAALAREAGGRNLIILHDGLSPKTLARAFADGAQDSFRNPYRTDLLVERIAALSARVA